MRLPQSYSDSCSWFTWMGELNLDEYLLPGQCMGRFADRLLFRAVAPLVLIVAIGLVSMLRGNFAFIYVYLSGNASAATTRGWLKVALRTSLRFSLFASFCLTPNVSRSIFASFDCVTFELDGSEPGASTRQSFLRNDLTLECYGEAHRSQVLLKAYVFLLIWPIGMPLLYVLVLLPVREDLRKQKQTRMVRATRFLHKEYQPLFFWWESLMLVQRLTLSGWVLLLSPQDDATRIFVGLLVAIGCKLMFCWNPRPQLLISATQAFVPHVGTDLTLLQFVQPCTRAARTPDWQDSRSDSHSGPFLAQTSAMTSTRWRQSRNSRWCPSFCAAHSSSSSSSRAGTMRTSSVLWSS